MAPTVLIIATSPYFPIARLSVSLASAGFRVEAVCPSSHPLTRTRSVRKTYRYRALAPLSSLTAAIRDAAPDLVIPGDESSAQNLHSLHLRESRNGSKGASICSLIERSVGPAETFEVVYQRARFMELAKALNVPTPETAIVRDVGELRAWARNSPFPFVLKADGTSGGEGVRVVRTLAEAQRAFHILQTHPVLARAVKRTLLDHDSSLLWPSLMRRSRSVCVQAFVSGREATSTVACWNGSVMAALHCEVLETGYATGPATVMRLTANPVMTATVEKLVRKLNLSGLHGFDFMVEEGTGKPYLIEINPRSTQVGHLRLGAGRDLPASLFAAVCGTPVQPAPTVTEKDIFCLFPQEWMRDPNSSFLQSGYHDVPWDEPELLRMCVERSRKQKSAAWRMPATSVAPSAPVKCLDRQAYSVSIPQER